MTPGSTAVVVVAGVAAASSVVATAIAVRAARRVIARRAVVVRIGRAGRRAAARAGARATERAAALFHDRRVRLAAAIAVLPGATAVGALTAVASVVIIAAPPAWERHRRRMDAADADAALPDVLERVARALRSGGTLVRAVAEAEPARPRVLANEWALLASRASDAGLAAAVERWSAARPSSSVRLTAAALQLAADVGGPQARAIDGVAATLRQRLAIAGERRAMSAQATASAVVIAAAPVVFAALAAAADPRFVSFLLHTPAGALFLACGLGLEVVGAWWMSRITRIEP